MGRKAISACCCVVAGFFVYGVSLIAFLNQPPVLAKFAVMALFAVPGLTALLVGLAVRRFERWQRATGIVLVSGAGFTALAVLTIACVFASPEFRKMRPDSPPDLFGDYVTGIACLALLLGLGAALLWTSRRPAAAGPPALPQTRK
ncbi:MAG: hypothetical protein JXR37_33820 [Kiritimatiellae bacterium]|nr:hypothetical protein [Kiritimatiellia bacterium]